MISWPVRNTFDVMVIGKRLAVLLLAVAVYYLAVGSVIQSFHLRVIHRGSAGSLMNSLLLGMLLSFRNQAAYARWWEARGLWGQLTNDTRNLAVKCAAFVPSLAALISRRRTGSMFSLRANSSMQLSVPNVEFGAPGAR